MPRRRRAQPGRRRSAQPSVAPRLDVVRPLRRALVRRSTWSLLLLSPPCSSLASCPEVRLVSAVLQVAGDLRLLGFRSAAPHRVSPLARSAGALMAPGLSQQFSRGANATCCPAVPAHPGRRFRGRTRCERESHQPGCCPVSGTRPPCASSRRTSPATQARMPCAGEHLDRGVDVVGGGQRDHADAAVQGGLEVGLRDVAHPAYEVEDRLRRPGAAVDGGARARPASPAPGWPRARRR